MKLYRYEFNHDGIFNSLDYLYSADMTKNDYEDFCKVDNVFDKKLPTADYKNIDLSEPFKFYFTEYGAKRFKKELLTLQYLFETYCSDDGNFDIVELDVSDNTDIVYKDRFQVAIKYKLL